MKFVELCEYFERIEATTKRLEKTAILAELLKELPGSEVRVVINLSLGQLAAAYERIQFNLAEKMLVRALGMTVHGTQYRAHSKEVEAEYKRLGDIGELSRQISESANRRINGRAEQNVSEVYKQLVTIAKESGTGSQERKISRLVTLLQSVGALECKYIVRMVNESLRLGFNESTMLDVLSYYACGSKAYSERLEKAYQMRPDVALLGEEVVGMGIEQTLANARIELGVPVIPALAQRLGSTDEMIEKMGRVYVEPKLDGTRVQIHFARNSAEGAVRSTQEEKTQQSMFEAEKPKAWIKTFTRNLDENTAQFPELLQIGGLLKAREVILDAEAVGYDPKSGELLPFQLTITRKRKHGVVEATKRVPLKFFVFDILMLDGETMINMPLSQRRETLKRVINPGKILVINDAVETEQAGVIREYHQRQLQKGYEGVLVKKKEGIYSPGRVNFNWVKLKEVENTTGKLADTIDGVVMGYYRGKGKRSSFGIGAFLVGIQHTANEQQQIVTVAKIGTGLTDEQFGDLKKRLQILESTHKPVDYVVNKRLTPDVWVKPEVVVEVAADEITKSPSHSAGYALRFPRLVKIREDKRVEQITTTKELLSM